MLLLLPPLLEVNWNMGEAGTDAGDVPCLVVEVWIVAIFLVVVPSGNVT